MGKPGFPFPLPVGAASPPHREGLGGRSPPKNNNIFILAVCAPRMAPNVNIGNQGFPPLLFTGMPGAPNGGWGVGKPGSPTPLPGGRVWEGAARVGDGETGFPHPPP